MLRLNTTACGRFVVLNGLLLDRHVFQELERWASERGLRPQDAVQLAVCALTERGLASSDKLPAA